jgi:hypothetical protein
LYSEYSEESKKDLEERKERLKESLRNINVLISHFGGFEHLVKNSRKTRFSSDSKVRVDGHCLVRSGFSIIDKKMTKILGEIDKCVSAIDDKKSILLEEIRNSDNTEEKLVLMVENLKDLKREYQKIKQDIKKEFEEISKEMEEATIIADKAADSLRKDDLDVEQIIRSMENLKESTAPVVRDFDSIGKNKGIMDILRRIFYWTKPNLPDQK